MRLPGLRFPVPRVFIRVVLLLTDFLERHPVMVRVFLRPVANAPVMRDLLPVVVRAFMGASAFDCHVVDRERGWVVFGEVKETIHPALFTRVFFETLLQELGEKEGKDAIKEIARESLFQEVKMGVEGKHVPGIIKPMIGNPATLEAVRSDPDLLRLAEKGMNMVIRLIGDEGGWGRIRGRQRQAPITATLENTLDVRYLEPSPEPVCAEYIGLVEGVASYITGQQCRAREVECQGSGAPRCVFEVERIGA